VVGGGVADDDARRVAHHDDADGVAATGVAVVRKRRAHEDLSPEELRARLRQRLAEVPSLTDGDDTPPAAAA